MSNQAPSKVIGLSPSLPFLVGSLFLLLIVLIVAFDESPNAEQFFVYRIVVSLGGAGFAVSLTHSLRVNLPLFRRGYVRATAATFVFAILYFFSPTVLAIDKGVVQSNRLIDEYSASGSLVSSADQGLDAFWTPEVKLRALSASAKERTQASIEAARDLIREIFNDPKAQNDFQTMVAFHRRIFRCIENETCDAPTICGSSLFKDIEAFRNTYCDRIIEVSDLAGEDIWNDYRNFSERTCRRDFLDRWVKYTTPAELSNVCIPVQCWARNTVPPFPCDVTNQLSAGTASPG